MFKFSFRRSGNKSGSKSADRRVNAGRACSRRRAGRRWSGWKSAGSTASAGRPSSRPAWPITAVATADFNGDGRPDIVSVGSASGRGVATVQINNGDGTFTPEPLEPTNNNPIEVQVGDFDGDGHEDIVTLASYYTGA